MPYDDERPWRQLSMRDVAAAWIACGLVALGTYLAPSGASRVDAALVASAGVAGAPGAPAFCAVLEMAEDTTPVAPTRSRC